MNLPEVEQKILEKQNQIKTIEGQLSKKKAELDEKKQIYSRGVIENAGRSRQLSSLDTQKRAVIETQAEFEALEGAKSILENELTELQKQRGLAELSIGQGERYRNAMTTCESTSTELEKLLSSLEKDLRAFSVCVNELIGVGQEITGSFSVISGDLPPNISLERFLTGEILELDAPDDREAGANQLKQKLLTLSDFAEAGKKIQELLQPFDFSVQDLIEWRHFVAKLRAETWRYAFVPKSKKVIPVDPETRRASNELEKARAEKELREAEAKERRERLAVG